MKFIVITFLIALCTVNNVNSSLSASELFVDIYDTCLSKFEISCIKPKSLSWISHNIDNDEIKITSDLSIIKTGQDNNESRSTKELNGIEIYDRIDEFVRHHSLKLNQPEAFKDKQTRSMFPRSILKGGLVDGLVIPLSDKNAIEGRGFVKKVIIPFLLGLKFKTTVMVPIALALIALKTWKAMTFGLLSLVLSGALLIFKIAKPKIVNYEVVHYPHHHVDHIVPHHIEHHVPHHIEHHIPHHIDHLPPPTHIEHFPHHHVEHVEHITHHDHIPHHDHISHPIVEHVDHAAPIWDHHSWARSSPVQPSEQAKDAQELAYNGQRR